MFDLSGKKALVTGGSRGIGRGIAIALAKQGAEVAINYVSSKDKAEETKREIEGFGGKAMIIQANVSQISEIQAMFEQVKNTWGKLDILVNNAGILKYAGIGDVTEEIWNDVINTNLRGQYFCAKHAIPLMQSPGRIINIASISSGGTGVSFPMISVYTSSKGGVVGMTENLALELGPKGITVNAIAPGAISTDMTTSADPKALDGMLTRIPRGRIGQPADIGAAAAFLASDEADYVTGVTLNVDGGWLAC